MTVASLPNEANSLKAVCRPVVKIQQALESIENDLSLEENEEQLFSKVHITFLEKLTKPIEELQDEVSKIEEKCAASAGVESTERKIDIAILDIVMPPLFELKKGLEVLSLQSSSNIHSGMVSVSIIESMVPPLQEIQNGLAQLGQDIESGQIKDDFGVDTMDAQKLLQSIAQSVLNLESNIENLSPRLSEDLQRSLFNLKTNLTQLIGSILDSSLSKYHLSLLENIKQPIDEINYCLRQTEEKSMSGSLGDLVEPLQNLQEKAIISEDLLRLSIHSLNTQNILTLQQIRSVIEIALQQIDAHEIRLLQEELQSREHFAEEKLLTSPSLSEAKSLEDVKREVFHAIATVRELNNCIAAIQEQILNNQDAKSMSTENSLSALKTFVTPFQEMQHCIAQIREIASMETVQDLVVSGDVSILKKVAQPLRGIMDAIKVIIQHGVVEQVGSISTQESISALKTLGQPLQELHNCIATIKQEYSIAEGLEDISSMQSPKLARPLNELQYCVDQLLPQLLEQAEDLSTADEVSALKTAAETIPELLHVAQIKQVAAIEDVKSLTSLSSAGSEKTKAQSLVEDLKQCVANVLYHCLEGSETLSLKYDKPTELTAAISKLKDLDEIVTAVHQQILHGSSKMLEKKDLQARKISTLTVSVNELESSIAHIQQEITSSPNQDISELKSLEKPIEELRQCLQVIHKQILEQVEDLSQRDISSVTGNLVQEIYPFIIAVQETHALEKLESLKEQESYKVINQLFEPIRNLQDAVLQIQEQTHISQAFDLSTQEGISHLQTVAKPLLNLKQAIVEIREQYVEPSLAVCHPIQIIKERANTAYNLLKCVEGLNTDVLEQILDLSTQEDVSALKTYAETVFDECSEPLKRAKSDFPIETLEAPSLDNFIQNGLNQINTCLTYVQTKEVETFSQPVLESVEHSLKEIKTAFLIIQKELSLPSYDKRYIGDILLNLRESIVGTYNNIQSESELKSVFDGPLKDVQGIFEDIILAVPNLEAVLAEEMLKKSQHEISSAIDRVHHVTTSSSKLEYLKDVIQPLESLKMSLCDLQTETSLQVDRSSCKVSRIFFFYYNTSVLQKEMKLIVFIFL